MMNLGILFNRAKKIKIILPYIYIKLQNRFTFDNFHICDSWPDEGGAGATHEAGGLAHDYQPRHQSALLKKVFYIDGHLNYNFISLNCKRFIQRK